MVCQVVQVIGQFVVFGVFDIGFVQYYQYFCWYLGEELFQGVCIELGFGWVVWVGDEYYVSLFIDGGEYCFQVMFLGVCFDCLFFGVYDLGGDWVDGEGMFVEYGVQIRCEVGMGDQVENVVGVVVQGYLCCIYCVMFGQFVFEFEIVVVRIMGQFCQFGVDSFQCFWVCIQWVFVVGEFDDCCRVDVQFVGQFIYWFVRDVG